MRLTTIYDPPNGLIRKLRYQANREEFLPADDKAEGPEGSKRYEKALLPSSNSSSLSMFTITLLICSHIV